MLWVAMVDDEGTYIEQVMEYIEQYTKEKNRNVRMETSCDKNQLLEHYYSQCDIILLDIEVSKLSGMDTAREIRKMDQDMVLVSITNMAQYTINSYEVGTPDYVLKPLSYYTFSVRLERAITRVKRRQMEEVLLNLPDGIKRLKTENIHYIEVQNRILHCRTDEGVFTVRGAPQEAEGLLRESHLVRCNHWRLVNLQHVSGVRKNTVVVADDELEISRKNKMAFLSAPTDYMRTGVR